tara:strand:- start:347 stop:595 length:249 start_codon:yes stop_codon:yes gene_type:complete
MNRMGRIFDNLMDLLVIGGKLVVEYIVDGVNSISWIWKEVNTLPKEEVEMWNGGGKKTTSETSESPTSIIYDGVYEDGKISE